MLIDLLSIRNVGPQLLNSDSLCAEIMSKLDAILRNCEDALKQAVRSLSLNVLIFVVFFVFNTLMSPSKCHEFTA